jgi:hypothetical protein
MDCDVNWIKKPSDNATSNVKGEVKYNILFNVSRIPI